MRSVSVLLLTLVSVITAAAPIESLELFRAVRNGDIAFLKAHIPEANINARDARGATLLMHAAAFGNIETMKLLVSAGADVNATNAVDATALLWCARDPHKARLLIEHGADVNARSKHGRTPLMLASLMDGGSETVALMIAKGADVNAKDSRGETALGLAAETGDVATMRLLIAKKADVNSVNEKGETPLIKASKSRRADAARILIERGAQVNVASTSFNHVRNGDIALIRLTPLHRAAAFSTLGMIQDLLSAGADVNARDSRGMTALMFSVAAETQNPAVIRALIKAGADVNARSNVNETALDWADKFRYPETLRILEEAGAKPSREYEPPSKPEGPRPDARTAFGRSFALLERSSGEFFKQSGCVGCHHQPLVARTAEIAAAAGLTVDEAAKRERSLQLKAQWLSLQEEFLQALNPGGGPNRLGENLLGLYSACEPPNTAIDAAVVGLAESQNAAGAWASGEEQPRPPLTESDIASTARAIRALQVYGIPARKAEFAIRIGRARSWLKEASVASTDDFAMRLLGLAWSGADNSEVDRAARALLSLQREDGGWAGNKYLKSDAFATGVALYALYSSGSLRALDAAYRHGVEYLLSTQYPNGAWYVRSRSIKFQPYFESGFPFADDQWISAAATAWASMALAPAFQPLPTRAQR